MPERNDNNVNSDSTPIARNFEFTVAGKPGTQWKLAVKETAPGSDEFDFEGFNPDPESGVKRFFGFTNSGPYGQLMINPEPDLGMPLDQLGFDFKLTGCILINPDGSTADRFSLTKKTVIQGVRVSFDQGSLELFFNGEPSGWYLSLLVIKDKNRIKGSDGYFVRERLGQVAVRELEDLANSLLKEMGILK